ncbi:hypothetical protein [Ralstonia phage RP13]|nr:hypothetical protein [Ralstonia phage RP13]
MFDSATLKNKLGIDHKYVIVDGLPSDLRYTGKDISAVYVRDLMFDEIKALSLYLSKDNYDINQLATAYRDVVKITTKDGNQFDLIDLELADFHYLVIVSSILTDEGANWIVERPCVECEKPFEAKFSYAEIEYDADKDLVFPMKLLGTDKSIHPLLVKDYIVMLDDNVSKIRKQFNLPYDEATTKQLLSYATSLEYSNLQELVDNINLINSSPKNIAIVKDINKSSLITIKPFRHSCPHCNALNLYRYDFSVIRGYL